MNSCKLLFRQMTSAANKLNLNGIFAPVVTPFKNNGDIDFEKIEFNIKKFENDVPLTGYVIAGSNGEAPFLMPSERIEIVRRVRKLMKPEKMVIGGATAESTNLAIEMSKGMADAGADGVLVMPPFYFKRLMTEEAIIRHFTTLADSSPIPIIIYNMPMLNGIDIDVNVLKKLSQHPNIRGIKDSDIRKMALTVKETQGNNFDVLVGSAGYLLPAMQLGCAGGIVALAGPLGNEVCKLASLIVNKKWEDAINLQKRIIPIDLLYFGSSNYGVPGMKATMDLMGFKAGFLRAPLTELSDKAKEHIKNELILNGFL